MQIKCCKDCTERYVGCHSKCQRYNEERERAFDEKTTIYEKKVKEAQYISFKCHQVDKWGRDNR